jgi:hypothetical protein
MGAPSPAYDDSPVPGIHFDAGQKAQFNAMRTDISGRMQALEADKQLSEAEKQKRTQKLWQEAEARLMKILTPAQRKVVQDREKKQEEAARQQQLQQQRLAAAATGGKNSTAASGLRMTPEQQAKLQAVHDNALKQTLAVLHDTSLSKQDQEMRIGFIFRTEQNEGMAILNADQHKTNAPPVGPTGTLPLPNPVKPKSNVPVSPKP